MDVIFTISSRCEVIIFVTNNCTAPPHTRYILLENKYARQIATPYPRNLLREGLTNIHHPQTISLCRVRILLLSISLLSIRQVEFQGVSEEPSGY